MQRAVDRRDHRDRIALRRWRRARTDRTWDRHPANRRTGRRSPGRAAGLFSARSAASATSASTSLRIASSSFSVASPSERRSLVRLRDRIARGFELALLDRLVVALVVRVRVGVRANHLRVNQRRALARARVRDRFAHGPIALYEIGAVDADDFEVRKRLDQPRDVAAGRVIFGRARNRVAVVFDHADDGEPLGADRVHELPELAFAGRAVADRDVGDFVLLDLRRRGAQQRQPLRRFGAAGALQALHAGRARAVHDVQRRLAPVRRHHAAARGRIVRRADRREQHLVRRHAEHERQRAIAIVGEEPVVSRLERHAGGDENRLVAGAADLEEDLALVLELDFLVVEASRQHHPAIRREQIVAGEAFVGARRPGVGLVSVGHRRSLHSRSPTASATLRRVRRGI